MHEVQPYLNRITGEFGIVTSEDTLFLDDPDDLSEYPEWQQEAFLKAEEITSLPDVWLPLPSQWDIHEYSIMEDYCYSVNNPQIADELFRAIRGSGAFRRFKNTLYRHNLEDDWFAFRTSAFKDIAVNWLDANEIPYVDDVPTA